MQPDQLPTTQIQLYGLIVLATLGFLTQLLQFAKSWMDANAIKAQNIKQLVNQGELHKALNGATAHLEAQAHALGVAQGIAAEKQATVDDRLREIRGNGP